MPVPASTLRKASAGSRGRNAVITAGLVGLVFCFSAVPFYLQRRSARLNRGTYSSPEPLSTAAVRRGNFLNTGSQDVGPDPDWQAGVYKGKRGPSTRPPPPPPSASSAPASQ